MSKHRFHQKPRPAGRESAPLAPSTLRVVADREPAIDDLIAAGELLDMRFAHGRAGLSLRAGKLLHLLVKAAGADAGLAKPHRVSLARLNGFHISKEDMVETARELIGLTVRLDVRNAQGKRATKVGPLLADVERDEDKDGELRFEFSPVFRTVIKSSNHWAVLSRRAVLAFRSRYSLRLYELVSIRVGLESKSSETFDLDDIRRLFGVEAGKLTTWQHLREQVLERATAEVSQLTGLAVAFRPVKRGRSVVGVTLSWREKTAQERSQAAQELDSSSVGRAARRDDTVEAIAGGVASAELADALRRLGSAVANNLRA